MEERGEVCLAEEAGRLWRSGMNVEEISRRMGVDVGWVETTVVSRKGVDQPDPDKA